MYIKSVMMSDAFCMCLLPWTPVCKYNIRCLNISALCQPYRNNNKIYDFVVIVFASSDAPPSFSFTPTQPDQVTPDQTPPDSLSPLFLFDRYQAPLKKHRHKPPATGHQLPTPATRNVLDSSPMHGFRPPPFVVSSVLALKKAHVLAAEFGGWWLAAGGW